MDQTRPLRVAIVSAHFPPNFVSGGTLVPQRSALALQRRGYDVEVFAGWIGKEHPRYSSWDDSCDGMAIHWISSYSGWSERHNYYNPLVAEEFGRWLERFEPDIVHLHSLQTLGAGLVHEAADRGLPVVVTLHDWWWWCARQFLCDRAHLPCCLVVDAGVCECERDRAWLEERNSYTKRALRRVSRIVAVSGACAAVAVSNGADPSRVLVIEPGIEPPDAHAHGGAEPVLRLVYAGGGDRMKGIDVLLRACRRLGRSGDWSLTCYGCEEWAGKVAGLPVELRPSFEPDRLGEVLAEADVLVAPSVMRESYSTLTRESISVGVPVVCSDSLGPEEVVEDSVNGLVVPAADAGALANALKRLVGEPALLDHLRKGCEGVSFPSTEEGAEQLMALYDEVLLDSAAPRPASRRVTRVLFVVGIDGAPLRYRVHHQAEALASLGVSTEVRHYLHPDITKLAENADVVVVYRVPATVQILEFIERLRLTATPVVFDVDDLIFDPELEHEIPALRALGEDEASLWVQGVRRYRTTMEQCDAFIGSTELLCSQAEAVTNLPAHRFSNGVGSVTGRLSDEALHRDRAPGPLRVAYLSGTKTHDHDWRYVEEAVADVLETCSELELWLVGFVQPSSALGRFAQRVRKIPFVEWNALPGLLRDVDVNLAPMAPSNLFNEAKSAVKWIEAGLVATPTIASPTQPFREAIEHGTNGLLAEGPSEWKRSIYSLMDDDETRKRLGARARRDVLLELSPSRQGRRYLSILEQIKPRASAHSTWVAEALNEPFGIVELDPYPPSGLARREVV